MCGIVGAVSTRNIVPVLVQGLERLEYRGYDSCGVAVHQDGLLRRARSTARVAVLEASVSADAIQSGTGIACDLSPGKFGPFEKQMFLGEFVLSGVNRVFLEKVNGEYQGACFNFLNGFQSAVLRMTWAKDGSLIVGESNRGWNSVGKKSFGLDRVTWNGDVPVLV